MDVVAAIARQQKTHPPLAGLPLAAQIGALPLFIGEAGAATVRHCRSYILCIARVLEPFVWSTLTACPFVHMCQDGEFLRERGIEAVVSLGTGDIAAKVSLFANRFYSAVLVPL